MLSVSEATHYFSGYRPGYLVFPLFPAGSFKAGGLCWAGPLWPEADAPLEPAARTLVLSTATNHLGRSITGPLIRS